MLPVSATGGSARSVGLSWVLALERCVLRVELSQGKLDLRGAEVGLEDAQGVLRRDVARQQSN